MMNSILQKDIDALLSDPLPWERFRSRCVLITGSTGLIGSMLVHTLTAANTWYRLGLTLVLIVRDPEKARLFFPNYNLNYLQGDLLDAAVYDRLPRKVDYIFHCAAITRSADMARLPIETLLTSTETTRYLLEFSKKSGLKAMVYLSSMEMYGTFPPVPFGSGPQATPVTEDMLGYLDLSNPRSSYPEGKRAAEFLCTAFYREYQTPVKIARLAQTFGAGVSPGDTRVFSQFAKSVMNDTDILLHTSGRSEGNYCYLADAIRGLLTILLLGADGEAYNITNEALHMTIREMAEFVARDIAHGRIRVTSQLRDDTGRYGYAPETRLFLSSKKLRSLGWLPQYDMRDMYENMIASWKEDSKTSST